jgi:hypothetical protein
MRIGLVGCVKSKQPRAAPARELYTSPLFVGRRTAVERTCDRWYILSAKHGLVAPTEILQPYDETLNKASRPQRERWSQEVLDALEGEFGNLGRVVFEAHAGTAYLDHGLAAGLEARGAVVERPTAGLLLGEQLAFYKAAANT